ncbi:J domain-containing protein [Fluviispira multicolorata]|uniref:DnaJ domain-containing protein n=1 Tax=Fluviispira multicolorata TaxID=2654512 RepID=A0A833N7Q6_9BACT|nr:J domain-containing protein [Fluviispira multicolorata]KAB8033236.1 DnaJ domain-containing protein [Fluviispira multicolorata]
MGSNFIDDESFEEKRIELEKKKQKKLEKQLRLKQKEEIIQELQKIREDKNINNHSFDICLKNSNKFPKGTLKWAFEFLSSNEKSEFEEVRKVYLERARLWHPDKNNVTNQEAMQYLNEAWQIVKKSK